MNNIQILDCTLRDGGYYTNWDFTDEVVKVYLDSLNQLPIEYLEIGYRNPDCNGYFGKFFFCPEDTLSIIKKRTKKKIAIILNEKDVEPSMLGSLLAPCEGVIDLVRIAVDPLNFDRALILAKSVKQMGFKVAFNTMYMSKWGDYPEMMQSLHLTDGLVDYFYMVDSFGGMFPSDVTEVIRAVRSRTNVKIGFHGHNNLELALANTLAAIEAGVDIVDATITGMGRGAGNLKTELLMSVLESKLDVSVNYDALSKVTAVFQELQEKYKWGTSLPYMVSGINSLPQKNVMEWYTKRAYGFNSIILALSNRSKGIADNLKLPLLEKVNGARKRALIIGGGQSVEIHKEGILQLLKKNPDIIVIFASSTNGYHLRQCDNQKFFCLVGNEGHRLEENFSSYLQQDIVCVLPPYPRLMGTYIPKSQVVNAFELPNISVCDRYLDAHTVLALETSKVLGCSELFIVGYDGYSNEFLGKKEQELFSENEYIFSKISDQSDFSIISLTPTFYKALNEGSLYNVLSHS